MGCGGLPSSGDPRVEQHRGVLVSEDDAAAAVDDEEPITADERTWAEIVGYRRVLTFVLRMAEDNHFRLDASTLRSMHFMLLEHDLTMGPGQYRTGPTYVRDDARGVNVYEGPAAERVPEFLDALTAELADDATVEPLVRAAMAHLNLVMIHPFRDGNGRMAPCFADAHHRARSRRGSNLLEH